MKTIKTTIDSILSNKDKAEVVVTTLTAPTLAGGKSNAYNGRVAIKRVSEAVIAKANEVGGVYSQLLKEEDPSTQIEDRRWGKTVEHTPYVGHNDKLYLEMVLNSLKSEEILVDGKPYTGNVDDLRIRKTNSTNKSQVQYSCYSLDNILEISEM